MARQTVHLWTCGLLLCVALQSTGAADPTATTSLIRSRGAKRAFGGIRGRPTVAPASASASSSPSTPSPLSFRSSTPGVPLTSPAHSVMSGILMTATTTKSSAENLLPDAHEVAARALTLRQSFNPHHPHVSFAPKSQSQSPGPGRLHHAPTPSPAPFTAGRSFPQSVATPRQQLKHIPIVALKFNLREDGSYDTSSETGDGTVRQERGEYNGAGMAVQGMYTYRGSDQEAVQVNYVADEFGFQPQGANIHPAIMQAVAEQVKLARSNKSRMGAMGLNGIQSQDEDYDDGGVGPGPKTKTIMRRVVVRRI